MSTAIQDTIDKVVIIKAPQERVYAAITDPAQIVRWFPSSVDGKLEQGERPVFNFGEDHINQVYIVAARPHDYFAYRWVPGSRHFLGDVLTQDNTLVEFSLETVDGGTKVTLKESGFADLPAEIMEQKYQDNLGGWAFMLGRLEQLFQDR